MPMTVPEIHDEMKKLADACGPMRATFLTISTQKPGQISGYVLDDVEKRMEAEAWADDFRSLFTKLAADIALRKAEHPHGKL